MLDHAAVEAAEASIDRFIASRSDSRRKANELEAMYAQSVRRHREKCREEHRLAWIDFHRGQAERLRRTMTALVEKHEAAAAQLLEGTRGEGTS